MGLSGAGHEVMGQGERLQQSPRHTKAESAGNLGVKGAEVGGGARGRIGQWEGGPECGGL